MPVSAEDELLNLLHSYRAFSLNQISVADLVQSVHRTSDRLTVACYCDAGLCCRQHYKHVNPHQNCRGDL